MGRQDLEKDFQDTYVFAALSSEISFVWHLMQTWVLCCVHTHITYAYITKAIEN